MRFNLIWLQFQRNQPNVLSNRRQKMPTFCRRFDSTRLLCKCDAVMDDAIRQYLSEIGKRGGASGKGTAWRSEVCRHAAIVRWRAYRARMKRKAEREEAKKRAEQKEREQLRHQNIKPQTVFTHGTDAESPVTVAANADNEPQPPQPQTVDPQVADEMADAEDARRKALLA
jgi:hypothetical protein